MVLDALNYIKDQLDGTLALPLVVPDGHLRQLRHDGQRRAEADLRDLAAQLCAGPGAGRAAATISRSSATSWSTWTTSSRSCRSVKPWIVRKEETPAARASTCRRPSSWTTYKQFSMCINCMLCYAACPVYGLDPNSSGPAAIALAQRYNLDSRDQGLDERLEILSQHDGIWDCTVVGECTEVCPKERRSGARDPAVQAHRHQGMVQVVPDAVGRQVN